MNKQITHNEHYIPQTYLRGFSCGDNMLYTNMFNKNLFNRKVPISSICFEKDLYEIKADNDDLISLNYLENLLSKFETKYSVFRQTLEKEVKENRYTFQLSKEQKSFIISFLTIQILRQPRVLEVSRNYAKEYFKDISDSKADIIAKRFCLPFFKEYSENDKELVVLSKIAEPMTKMNFYIGLDLKKKLMTSDNPTCIFGNAAENLDYDCVIFPLSSSICVYLSKTPIFKRTTFLINDKYRCDLNYNVIYCAYRQVFSSYQLNNEDIMKIEEIRMQHFKDKQYENSKRQRL